MGDKPAVDSESACLLKPKSLIRKPAKAKLLNRSVLSPSRQIAVKEIAKTMSKKPSPDKRIAKANG